MLWIIGAIVVGVAIEVISKRLHENRKGGK